MITNSRNLITNSVLCSTVQPTPPIIEVGWDNLQIVETHDDEGRIELVSEDQLCEILGLKDDEEEKKQRLNQSVVEWLSRGPIMKVLPFLLVMPYQMK